MSKEIYTVHGQKEIFAPFIKIIRNYNFAEVMFFKIKG